MRSLLVTTAVLIAGGSLAQGYGNEWIDPDRRYWKFKVAAEGIHRIDSLALAQAGVPLWDVDPRDFMLFTRQEQVHIHVKGEDDGVFNSDDFIEFHGIPNDGWFDDRLWTDPGQQPNPAHSLFNDTIQYYLTWDDDAPKKRIVNYENTDFDTQPTRAWFWSEAFLSRTGRYQIGERQLFQSGTGGAASCLFDPGEGWFHTAEMSATGNDVEQVWGVLTRSPYTAVDAPDAIVNVGWTGTNNAGGLTLDDHHGQVRYGPSPGIPGVDTIWNGYRTIRTTFNMPSNMLAQNTQFRFKVVHDLDGPGQVGEVDPNYLDRQVGSLVHVRYPRNFQMNDQPFMRMWLEDAPGEEQSHIDFGTFPFSPILIAFGDTARRIIPTQAGNRWKAMIPAHTLADETFMFLGSEDQMVQVTALTPVNGSGFFTDMGALGVDSAMLIISHASLMPGALQYAAYRENSQHNRYNTVVVDVDELYDQFGGGIPKHPWALRMFARYTIEQFPSPPKAMFLIGKSVQLPTINSGLVGYRTDPDAYAACLVPSYGYPSSDPAITMALFGDPRVMSIPVGRLSASNVSEVMDYLAKVQQLEGQQRAAWMKNILHFRGGFNAQEASQLGFWLEQFKQIADSTYFGANVNTFVKTGSDIIQQASADSVRNLIEEGVSLMTFFAHASGSGFDISIDNPANYQWSGRYPMIIGNSCYTGNIHLLPSISASESFVLQPNSGAIGFLASVDLGITSFLGVYSRFFYESFSRLNYGRSIGEHMRYATYQQIDQSQNLLSINNAHTFTLHGDPTVVIPSSEMPDYMVDDQSILFDPPNPTAEMDSITVRVAVANIGKAVNGVIPVALDRSVDGVPLGGPPLVGELTNVFFRDTIAFRIPVLVDQVGQGNNQFTARVNLDPTVIDEGENVDYFNNTITTPLSITSGDLLPIWPYDFAITPDAAPPLRGSTGDPFAPVRTYLIQIDTTDTFNSPVMESGTVTAPGGVITWQPSSIYALNNFQDSTVFYWRCSPDSIVNDGFRWFERSFQYITGKEGWGQAHYFQFKDDRFNQIDYDRPNRDFKFFQGERNIRAFSKGFPVGAEGNLTEWLIDVTWMDGNGCGNLGALHVAVVDPATFEAWGTRCNGANPDNGFGNYNDECACRNRVELFFGYRTNSPDQLSGLNDLLQNVVPDGHYIMMYTWQYLDQDGLQANGGSLVQTLAGLGAENIMQVQDSVPYIFFARKGHPETAEEAWGAFPNDLINLSVWVPSLGTTGTVTTMEAGPAFAWNALYWDESPRKDSDSTRIKVIGVTPQGVQIPLLDLEQSVDSVPDLGDLVDAAQYPRLRLQAFMSNAPDEPEPLPTDLHRWQLLSAPVPECAIDPPLGFLNEVDSLFEGMPARVAVAVHNISTYDMDSLLMAAWVTDRNNVKHRVHYKRRAPLPAGGFLVDTIQFATNGFAGMNTLVIEANTVDTLTGVYDQMEQYRFNNIATLRFAIEEDLENPLLDVTFDGIHILDGDIVSARPEIQITLKDENPVLLFDSPQDTAYFKVFLAAPGQALQRIYFRDEMGNEQLQFVPTTGPENVANIFYRPRFELDGKYMLTVQATDISLNQSGDQDYKVGFEVVNRPTITEVLNYPNPFTTSTRFVFTITGSEAPTYMKVQIMTITGRVVREVKMHELGPIRVGRNISEFSWDGTDEFGDRLARGVYLYRVIAQLHGEDIEYRATGASEYFTKGFGKMYLLR